MDVHSRILVFENGGIQTCYRCLDRLFISYGTRDNTRRVLPIVADWPLLAKSY